LKLPGAPTIDLRDNDLIINYTATSPVGSWDGTAYTGVTGMIQSGRTENGTWDGSGIITSTPDALSSRTTLGVAEASDVLGIKGSETAVWNGVTVDATTVLVKYTYAGDANLSGNIDADDYALIDFYSHVANVHGYFNGDFNYDGDINADDYALIDFNNNAQGSPL